jgi:multidrug efflux system membrane fusion protein
MSRWFWAQLPSLPTSSLLLLGFLLAATAMGCQQKNPEVGPAAVPVVPVSRPVQRTVTDYVDFTGRTDAVHSVNIIARVTGYLTEMPFKEGSEVKKGDLLFVIDPRPYQAQLDQAQSQLKLNKAQLDLAKATLLRYEALDKSTPGAVSKQALDQYRAAVAEAEARFDAQIKSLEIYNLNKEFTHVVSPIDGQVSRYYLTLGNLVNQDQTLLTTVVSLDPMYAYFDMDERTLLQIRKAIAGRKITLPEDGDIPVLMGLQNEDGFPHRGTINFVNNEVNSTTGSITMRGVFENPRLLPPIKRASAVAHNASPSAPASAASPAPVSSPSAPAAEGEVTARRLGRIPRLLSPGMYVRIRLPIGEPHPALLIIDRAIQSDQGLKFVYVVDVRNKVQTVSITTGPLQEDGLRVVTGNIKPDDWVVVGAIQQVRARMLVRPEQRPMPSLAGVSNTPAQPADPHPARRGGPTGSLPGRTNSPQTKPNGV